MSEQERPLMDRVWEFTKDISVKVSRKAEKHWKINTLRVEIASIRHRINVKYKELGRYVYESVKSQTLEEDSYKASLREFFDELKRLEGDILQRENRIEILEREMQESEKQQSSTPPPIPANITSDADPSSEADSEDEETTDSSATTADSEDQDVPEPSAQEPKESEGSSNQAENDSEDSKAESNEQPSEEAEEDKKEEKAD